MSFSDLINLSVDELRSEKEKILRKLCVMNIKKGMGDTIKTHELKDCRRTIARIETAINQKRSNDDK